MSKVLIFGAGGFVGSYLCKEFLNNGYKVIGTDKGEGTALPPEVDFYKADLMQADEVAAQLRHNNIQRHNVHKHDPQYKGAGA